MIHEFNRSQEKLLIKPGALMMGAFLVALTFETTATISDRLSRTSRSTVDSVYNPRAEKSTLYIPGFHANGHVIGEMFHPVFSENGTTHAAVWETSGFRPDVTMERVIEARQKDDGVPLHVHVSSMGLHPFADWMKISEFRDKIGPIESLVIDSSFNDVSDISPSTRGAMYMTRMLPPTFTPGKIFEGAMGLDTIDITHHDSDMYDDQIEIWRKSSAKAPYGAARDQVTYILKKQKPEQGFGDAFRDIGTIRYVSAMNDQVTNLYTSFEKINTQLGGRAIHYIDLNRPEISHAMGPAFRQTIANLLYYSTEEIDSLNNLVEVSYDASEASAALPRASQFALAS